MSPFKRKRMKCVLIYNLSLYLQDTACKLYDNNYMVASAQITNTEIFAFIAVQVL